MIFNLAGALYNLVGLKKNKKNHFLLENTSHLGMNSQKVQGYPASTPYELWDELIDFIGGRVTVLQLFGIFLSFMSSQI